MLWTLDSGLLTLDSGLWIMDSEFSLELQHKNGNRELRAAWHITLYTSRKPLQHLLATRVPSCEEPGSAHEQTCKISREELSHPIKLRRDELRQRNFFVSLPLWCRLHILVDSCAEWGWPDTHGTIQGYMRLHWQGTTQENTKKRIFIYREIL